jgi:hypothetical protein
LHDLICSCDWSLTRALETGPLYFSLAVVDVLLQAFLRQPFLQITAYGSWRRSTGAKRSGASQHRPAEEGRPVLPVCWPRSRLVRLVSQHTRPSVQGKCTEGSDGTRTRALRRDPLT